MDIHRFEKLWIAAAMVLIVGFVATVAYGAVGAGIEMVNDEGGQIDPDAVNEHPDFSEPGVEQVGENHYAVYVVAERFQFRPGSIDPIRVPTNATVTFYLTSSDVVHGFQLAGTNLNTMVIPGQIAQVSTEFDEPGTYGIICNEYCGAAHHQMEGTMEVVPEDEYEGGDG